MRPFRLDSQILIYFGTMVLLVVLLLVFNNQTQNTALKAFNDLIQFNNRNETVGETTNNLIRLQLFVDQYEESGNPEILTAMTSLRAATGKSLSYLAANQSNNREAELIASLNRELQEFFDTLLDEYLPQKDRILQLRQDSNARLEAHDEKLYNIFIEPPRHDFESVSEIFATYGRLQGEFDRFLYTQDFIFEQQHLQRQNELHQLVEGLDGKYQGVDAWLLEADRIATGFQELIQIEKQNLYTVNVDLAGHVNEMANLARYLEDIYAEEIATTFAAIQSRFSDDRNRYLLLAALATFLAILLASFVSWQIGRPIHQLIDVFQNLASDKRVTKVPMLNRNDDFGKLARAAEIFRHKNEDTQYLLHQSQTLVRELQELNAELSEAIEVRRQTEASLAKRQQELERSNKDLTQFAYAASHDLQEPLRMVTSYLQLLEKRYKDELDEDAKDFIGFAVDGAARMQSLIRSLLDYSRIGTHGREFEQVDLNRVVEQALQNIEVLVEENEVVVEIDKLPAVWGDEVQLQTLLQNLLSNSIRYRSEAPPGISIRCDAHEDYYEIQVSDNGIGFDPQFADRIFTIFQRLHTRDQYAEGTGIGLALCKRIVERHGGKIWAVSKEGEGTTMYFQLPTKPQGVDLE